MDVYRTPVHEKYWTVYSLSHDYRPDSVDHDDDDDDGVKNMQLFAKRDARCRDLFGMSFPELESSFMQFNGPYVFAKGMKHTDRYKNVREIKDVLDAVASGHPARHQAERKLLPLDEFAIALFCTVTGGTDQEIALQWPQVTKAYAAIMKDNCMLLTTLFYVPAHYGCLTEEFLVSRTPPAVSKIIDSMWGNDPKKPKSVVVADCTEKANISATESLAATRTERYSTKAHTRTDKTLEVCTLDRTVIFVTPVHGGRVPEVIGLSAFLLLLPFFLLLLVDRGYRDLVVPKNVYVGIPSNVDDETKSRSVFSVFLDSILSGWRAAIECVNALFKQRSAVSAVSVDESVVGSLSRSLPRLSLLLS